MRRTIAEAVGAAILVAGTSGGATAVRLIGSAQIEDNSVRSVDIRDGDLAAADLQPSIQTTIQSALTGYTVRESRQTLSGDTEGGPIKVWQVHCPAGKVALGGGEQIGEAFASWTASRRTTRPPAGRTAGYGDSVPRSHLTATPTSGSTSPAPMADGR